MQTETIDLSSATEVTGDPFDPMTPFNLQEPFRFFTRLREERPVYWSEKYSFWMITRCQDVKAILRAPNQFSSATEVEFEKRREQLPASVRGSFDVGKRFAFSHLQASDAPKHAKDRGTVVNAFTPQVGPAIRVSIQGRVDRLLDEMERAKNCDFVSAFAYPLPSSVIFDLLGVPAEHHQTINESSAAAATFSRAVYNRDFEAIEHVAERLTESEKVLQGLIHERRRLPKNDLISSLLQGEGATAWMPDDELVVLFHFLLFAGHETTANLLSGSLRYLLERRELWEQLCSSPEMIPGAVEELLRFVSPVLWLPRMPVDDIELDGRILRRGTRLQVGIGAANHDPNEFPNPERLDLTRPKFNSLAFGYGPHFCLGAALSRMETRVALSRLLERIPQVQLATRQFEYRPVYFLRALKCLPIVVRGS